MYVGEKGKALKLMEEGRVSVSVFRHMTKDQYCKLCYMSVPCPWPVGRRKSSNNLQTSEHLIAHHNRSRSPATFPQIADRDFFFTYVYLWADSKRERREQRTFVGYTYSSNKAPPRQGYVRAQVKYQGFVVVPEASPKPSARLTFLANWDLGGSVPGTLAKFTLRRIMAMSRNKALAAERWEPTVVPHGAGLPSSLRRLDSGRDEDRGEDGAGRRGEGKGGAEAHASPSAEIRAENAAMKRAIAERDELIAEKDDSIAEKEKEIMELRRRLPRVEKEEL